MFVSTHITWDTISLWFFMTSISHFSWNFSIISLKSCWFPSVFYLFCTTSCRVAMQCTSSRGNHDRWTPNSSALACGCEKNSPYHAVDWHAQSAFQNQKYFPISILLKVICCFTAWPPMPKSSLRSFIWCFFPLLLGFYSCSFWLWL